jgi:hypothetical protein
LILPIAAKQKNLKHRDFTLVEGKQASTESFVNRNFQPRFLTLAGCIWAGATAKNAAIDI